VELNQERNILRETLRLITSIDSSFIDPPLASLYVLGLENVGLEQESFTESGLMDVDDFDDTIILEL
jgi:hypothetical protein